jgi:RimJ/RimL family protein N-acetyltransferase
MGMRRIQLKVFARNTGALRLYHRLGYEVEGTRRQAIKIGDSYEDLIEMAKTTVHGNAA